MKKLYRQNIRDFVISNYGDIDQLSKFLNDNNLVDIEDYYYQDKFTVSNVTNNEVLESGVIIATGIEGILPEPDFNEDFSEDFLI